MRIAKVPIDMSSEQKNLQGIISSRQAIYLGIGGLILYSYIPTVFGATFTLFGWLVAIFFSFILAVPVLGIVAFLGFGKVEKYQMNRDYYLYVKFQRKTQYGSWRKGL
ncbi:PrgI family mobile element protein [Viridibacillus arvi]|uniref:PrgI family mobile element protein n=1 Tax=Viridibacillus arvi TaxID=263475 RepID=UPI003D2A0FD6